MIRLSPKRNLLINLMLSTLVLASCSNSEFKGSSQNATKDPSCKTTPSKCKDNKNGIIEDEGTNHRDIQKHEAVLAVRDMSCAFCHASVSSNVISDFAVSSGEDSAEQSFRKILYQVNHADGPAGQPVISGNFIIPKGETSMIDRTAECVFSSEMSAASAPRAKHSILDVLNKCVAPAFKWGPGSEKFVTKDEVAINPVSSIGEIKSIVGGSKLTGSGMALVGDSKVTGITGSPQSGFSAASSISCEGAIVIDGPVVLKDVVINTEKGCRIYSTASIFVFGNTRVTTNSANANLQLMSPLFVGLDIAARNIEERLNHENTRKLATSRGSGPDVASLISADASKLQIVTNEYLGNSNVGYSRIAVSAPVVYSRNTGAFSGSIIAEHFIGKIGALSFSFDPIFNAGSVAMFPEINRRLVTSR